MNTCFDSHLIYNKSSCIILRMDILYCVSLHKHRIHTNGQRGVTVRHTTNLPDNEMLGNVTRMKIKTMISL